MGTTRLGAVLWMLVATLGCTRSTRTPDCPSGALGPKALDRGLLILGEIHGTRQAPAVVLATACEAARRDGSAWIGLEQPPADQPLYAAFLAGGSEGELLASEAWQRKVQDGRNSEAILELLRGVRDLRNRGLRLEVVAFDLDFFSGGARSRDARMAEAIRSAQQDRPGVPGVVLVGNIHATRRLQLPKAMAWHLEAGKVPFRNLNVASEGGAAWLSGGVTAGVSPLSGSGPKAPPGQGDFTFEDPPDGFDGWWFAGRLEASSPAVKAAGAPAATAH